MTKEPVLAKILRYLIYTTAFVPLIIFSQYMSPFHFGKVVVFRSIIEIAAVLYILLIWRDRTYLPKLNKIFWTFLFFTLAFSVTTITSIQPYVSFWGSLERMGGLWTFWHYLIFFTILISVLKTKQHWFIFLDFAVFAGILSALYGFGQKTDISFFVGGGNRARIFGTIGNAALFAGYQLLVLFLSLTLFFKPDNSKLERIIFVSGVLLTTIAVLMTAVRGSMLALGVGFLLFAFLYFWNYKSALAKKLLTYLIIFAVGFALFSFTMKDTPFVKNSPYLTRITNFSLSAFTVQTRFWAWQAGLKGWSEGPKTVILGWGPENFSVPFSKYFNPKFFTGLGAETLFDRAHNMFVEILVTMGLLGFLSYVSIFVVILMILWKLKQMPDKSLYAIGLIPLVVAYIIHNSFIFDTSANFILFFIILGFISFISTFSESDNSKRSMVTTHRYNSALYGFTATILMIVAVFIIYKTNILPAEANYATTRAITFGWNNYFNDAVAKYEEAISYDVPGKYDFRQRFAQYILEQGSKSNSIPGYLDVAKIAIAAMQKSADENPDDYLPELYLSRLNVILGKTDPNSPYNDIALGHVKKALALSPTFIRTYYEMAQIYLNKKDLNTAAEYFKKAAELNPDVALSFWYWGAVEFDRGNEKFALGLLDKALGMDYQGSESDYAKMISIYFKYNQFDKIVIIYPKLIGLNPNNAQYHASAAAAYVKVGDIDNAVNEARLAAKLDPSFEREARAFVQNLGREF